MEWAHLIPMIIFIVVSTGTPGPNNIMLLASGANYGYLRTIPHILGIAAGMGLLALMTMGGLGEVFERVEIIKPILKVAGSLYLLWLAWKIANAPVKDLDAITQDSPNNMTQTSDAHHADASQHEGDSSSHSVGRPMTWFEAMLFQFVNPKSWMMAITGISSFTLSGDRYIVSGLSLVILLMVLGATLTSCWAGLGTLIKRLLKSARRQRIFNYTMAVLTVATIAMIVS